MLEYLHAYATHFNLYNAIKLSTSVCKIEREDKAHAPEWLVTTTSTTEPNASPKTTAFDRIIVATGPHNTALMPEIKGRQFFQGEIIHSQSFKVPKKYTDKTVLVVGISDTAADTIRSLRDAKARKVYVSHGRVPRIVGTHLDHAAFWCAR